MPSKPIKDQYWVVQVADNPEHSPNDSVNSADGMDNAKITHCFRLNTKSLLKNEKINAERGKQPRAHVKRKVSATVTLVIFYKSNVCFLSVVFHFQSLLFLVFSAVTYSIFF